MKKTMALLSLALALCAAAVPGGSAMAQAYRAKPVTLVVGFAAG